MSGKKQYRTHDYLTAFSKISSSQLHSNNYSRRDIITLWNSLQKTPTKVRLFTFSLTENNSIVSKRVEDIYKNNKYAYICHDKDKSAEHKHYHYLLIFDSPRSFKSIANDLEIPVTMLQKVYSKKGMLDYLTHENDPNKYHYDLSEIHANFSVEEEKKTDDPDIDPWQEFQDFVALREGRMSYREWFDKYSPLLQILRHYIRVHLCYIHTIQASTPVTPVSRALAHFFTNFSPNSPFFAHFSKNPPVAHLPRHRSF